MACLVRNFERPASDIYKEVGLGDSAGFRLKERLVKAGQVHQVETNLGKGGKRAVFLVPDLAVLEAHGIQVSRRGRGGVLHKHFQESIAAAARKKGHKAALEVDDVDVSIVKADGLRVGVQVVVTSRPHTEAANALKVPESHDRAVVAFIASAPMLKAKEIAPRSSATMPCGASRSASSHRCWSGCHD